MNVRAEIEKAVDTKQGKKEAIEEYLERLIDDVNDEDEGLSDKQFNKLSKEAQGWLNKGAAALDKNKPVPAFPDAEEEEEEEEEKPAKKGKKGKKAKKVVEEEPEDEEDEEEDEKPKKKGKKGKKADTPDKDKKDKPAAKKDKASAAKKEKTAKKPSAISRMQYFCCKHPKMDKVKIGEKVRKEGYEFSDSTLSIQYGQAHKIMAILTELNG